MGAHSETDPRIGRRVKFCKQFGVSLIESISNHPSPCSQPAALETLIDQHHFADVLCQGQHIRHHDRLQTVRNLYASCSGSRVV